MLYGYHLVANQQSKTTGTVFKTLGKTAQMAIFEEKLAGMDRGVVIAGRDIREAKASLEGLRELCREGLEQEFLRGMLEIVSGVEESARSGKSVS